MGYTNTKDPYAYQRSLVRLVHEQGHFGVDETCEQRAYCCNNEHIDTDERLTIGRVMWFMWIS